jgi:hypothetical protein
MEHLNYTIENCTNPTKMTKKFYQHLSLADRKNIEKYLNLKADRTTRGLKLLLNILLDKSAFIDQPFLVKLSVAHFMLVITPMGLLKNMVMMLVKEFMKNAGRAIANKQN